MSLVPAVGATVMLTVAAHCGYQLVRLTRTRCGGRAEEVAHLLMALAMAAMFVLPLSRLAGAVLLFGALACLGWSLLRFVHRPGISAGGLCVSSVAMGAMVWAMLPARDAGSGPTPELAHEMAGMRHMRAAGVPTQGLAQLQTPLLWGSLAVVAALIVALLVRGRVRDAVMGAAMALMLGTMV